MNSGNPHRSVDEEAEAALAALKRARLRAEKVAVMTNTEIVEVVNGEIVLFKPNVVQDAEPTAPTAVEK